MRQNLCSFFDVSEVFARLKVVKEKRELGESIPHTCPTSLSIRLKFCLVPPKPADVVNVGSSSNENGIG